MDTPSDHTEKREPTERELLEELIVKHEPDAYGMHDFDITGPLDPRRLNCIAKVIVTHSTNVLLFIRPITDTLENYNTSISNQTFGPELIHQTDYVAIQLQLAALQTTPKPIRKCMYLVKPQARISHHYVCTLLYDRHFVEWHKSEARF